MSALRYIADNWDTLGPEALTQVRIVLIVVVLAAAAGIPLGVVGVRRERFGELSLAVASAILTIPSFALFVVLRQALLAFGDPPVIAGLALYALLPMIRNTRAGIRGVDAAVLEAARGMGMRPRQVLLRVELPLALPVIVGGLRQATVMVVAIATVGAVVGSNNLGQTILEGINSGNRDVILGGVIPVAVIGVTADLVLAAAQRLLDRGRAVAVVAA
ncbi:MAG TPA: ABC transporter permease [Candidatus Dormibacteraeota bacterium]|jgi:osmoprotectant transport system permease protein|nr:ABC transporter permease [Candidatus Dormibacteraeota bacterium]